MTINYAREMVIDFTKPFMNLGISILFKVRITPPSTSSNWHFLVAQIRRLPLIANFHLMIHFLHILTDIGVDAIDTDQSANSAVFIYESTGCGDLAVCHGCLHPRQFHSVRHGSLLTLRVEQSSPLQWWNWCCRESVLHLQQFLVHNGHLPATRIWSQS